MVVILGFAALRGHPEMAMLPVFDAQTRVLAARDLATWLRERGFEATACTWENAREGLMPPRDIQWRLVVGEPTLPALPR